MIWTAIGCGFGERDLAKVRVEHFDAVSYDCRRGKTQMDRYGDTPKLVWKSLEKYRAKYPRHTAETSCLSFPTKAKARPATSLLCRHGGQRTCAGTWRRRKRARRVLHIVTLELPNSDRGKDVPSAKCGVARAFG